LAAAVGESLMSLPQSLRSLPVFNNNFNPPHQHFTPHESSTVWDTAPLRLLPQFIAKLSDPAAADANTTTPFESAAAAAAGGGQSGAFDTAAAAGAGGADPEHAGGGSASKAKGGRKRFAGGGDGAAAAAAVAAVAAGKLGTATSAQRGGRRAVQVRLGLGVWFGLEGWLLLGELVAAGDVGCIMRIQVHDVQPPTQALPPINVSIHTIPFHNPNPYL